MAGCSHGSDVCEPCAYDRGYAAAQAEATSNSEWIREKLDAIDRVHLVNHGLRTQVAALTAALEAIAEKADNYLAAAILPVSVGIHLQGLTHGLEEIRQAALDAAGGA